MSEQGQEQNKSEEPTPYKLQKAREKGQVARGMDLGFVGSLVALAVVAVIGGEAFFGQLAQIMKYSFVAGISGRGDPAEAVGVVASSYWGAFEPLIVLGMALVLILGTLEILQLRGFIFTTHPLKPDFQRLNPAKGLKRLFSMRMLKETLKSIVKLLAYSATAWLIITAAITTWGIRLVDAGWLVRAIEESGGRLLFAFIALAMVFMVIDQVIVRREFHKQMRMGRGELTREIKEREGEPRQKQKRKEIHQQMREQAASIGQVPGSDLLVVNPEHYAIALKYDPQSQEAPVVVAKGRDHLAQLMKRKARLHAIPIFHDPALARRLHAECRRGAEIAADHYHDVARLYRLLRSRSTDAADVPPTPDLPSDPSTGI